METWNAILTNPLCVTGFALFMLLAMLARKRDRFGRILLLSLAMFSIFGSLTVAYRAATELAQQAKHSVAMQTASQSQLSSDAQRAKFDGDDLIVNQRNYAVVRY